MGTFYRFIVGFFLLACHAWAIANSPKTESAWLEDPTGQWTLEDVQPREFTPFTGLLNKGYSDKALWIRLKIEPVNGQADRTPNQLPLILRVRPSFIDDIRLYDPLSSTVQIAGDLHSKSTQDYRTLNHNFLVQQGAAPRTLWLRMESTSSRLVHFDLLALPVALEEDRAQELFFNVNVSFLLLLTCWAVVQWFTLRDKVIGWFAISKVVLLIYTVAYFGFPALVWPDGLSPAGPSDLVSLFAILACISSLEFQRQFLSSLKTAKSLLWAMKVVVGLGVFILLAQLLGYERMALPANSLLLGCATILMFMTAMTAPIPWLKPKNASPDAYLSKIVLVGIYALIMIALLLQGLTLLGLIPSEIFALNGIVMYGALSSLMMFGLLNRRNRGIRQRYLHTLVELENVRQGREKERIQKEDQEKLFAMLAHELKTPLATLQMWMNSGQPRRDQMERAIRDMNLVIERCVHAGQISDEGLKPVWQDVDAKELTVNAIADCAYPARVQFNADAQPSWIKTDVQMLTIALSNLLDNACKYSAPHTPIQVLLCSELKDGQDGWRWTISNQVGQAGLPNPEQLFTKYYRSPHARRQSGSGLGLFLVKRLLELLEGHIGYTLESDQISFSVWLPG